MGDPFVGYGNVMQYKAGSVIDPSSIDNATQAGQRQDFFYIRKALIETRKKEIFTQLADSVSMPAHHGKTIKRDVYVPLLDDRNINDQGIDATGQIILNQITIFMRNPDGMVFRAVGGGVNAADALLAAENSAMNIFRNIPLSAANGMGVDWTATKTNLLTRGWIITGDDVNKAVPGSGNLYGSLNDVGRVRDKLPILGENGGRANRVGFSRYTLESTMNEFGFFYEYTEDSYLFDSDDKLREHIAREALNGAHDITEDALQLDILNSAGVALYGGNAMSMAGLHGNNDKDHPTDPACVLTYDLLRRLDTILNNNNTPMDTDIITGSKNTNTVTIAGARYAYIGSELKSTLLKMKDYHGEKAFKPVQQYAYSGKTAIGEIGSIDSFRFIETPRMKYWEGAGSVVTPGSNKGFRQGSPNGSFEERYNVYPMLVVGNKSFSTIGFQTDGKQFKFDIINKSPSRDTASMIEPFGKKGFWSIRWRYGFICYRPERIGVIKVVAEM
ncbi:MAG: N4-gp56 family major capsid protein [Deferribacteraceae bacterium]|jgi:N4-gp56 family major capsid protein|nr:N4-gp56 family major capsid protein [Deferribacteraceae bacterium]